MKNLSLKEAQKILDNAPKGETHFYVSRLLKMGEVAYFSRGEDGVFVADEWVIFEMALGGEYGVLSELRAMLKHGKREEAKTVVDAVVSLGRDGAKWSYEATERLEHLILECVLDCEMDDRTDLKGTVACGGNGFDENYYRLICTIEEFNQCVKEMTGCVAVHQEWLAKVNAVRDMREDDNKELIEQIKTIEHVMAVQQKSINWLVDSQAELLAEKQKLERLI